MPPEYSEVHGGDVPHYKLINMSVHLANTNIPSRDRPACVQAKSGLRAYQAEHLTSDTGKLTSQRSLLGDSCQSF